MTATVKLAGFAAGLLLVFGGATVAGGAIGPDREGSDAAAGDDAMAAHGGRRGCPRPRAWAGGLRGRPAARPGRDRAAARSPEPS